MGQTEEILKTDDLKSKVSEQLRHDLHSLLSQYNRADFGLKAIAQRTTLSEKTLKRLISGQCEPHYNTIRNFYSYFFKIMPDVASQPEYQNIKTLVEREALDKNEFGANDFEELLRENKVFRTMFLYSRSGNFKKSWVEREFGRYGMDLLQKMLDAGIIIEESPNQFTQGPLNLTKGPQSLLRLIGDMLEHVSPERLAMRGFNLAFYAVENVDLETKNLALEMTEKFRRDMIDLIVNKSKRGQERLFVSAFLDTLKDLPGDVQ